MVFAGDFPLFFNKSFKKSRGNPVQTKMSEVKILLFTNSPLLCKFFHYKIFGNLINYKEGNNFRNNATDK